MTLPQRKQLVHDVILKNLHEPCIVFLTVCTKARRPWLATNFNHELLCSLWQESTSWLVGRYVLMPDHMHLFVSPGHPSLPLSNWVAYWKSSFTKKTGRDHQQWQHGYWDRRLRRDESYAAKWEYVVNNPLRHGLATNVKEWSFQGEIFPLPWW